VAWIEFSRAWGSLIRKERQPNRKAVRAGCARTTEEQTADTHLLGWVSKKRATSILSSPPLSSNSTSCSQGSLEDVIRSTRRGGTFRGGAFRGGAFRACSRCGRRCADGLNTFTKISLTLHADISKRPMANPSYPSKTSPALIRVCLDRILHAAQILALTEVQETISAYVPAKDMHTRENQNTFYCATLPGSLRKDTTLSYRPPGKSEQFYFVEIPPRSALKPDHHSHERNPWKPIWSRLPALVDQRSMHGCNVYSLSRSSSDKWREWMQSVRCDRVLPNPPSGSGTHTVHLIGG